MSPAPTTIDRMLSPGEVALLFRVSPKTVTRWAKQGKVQAIRTPGGHRRYRESEVRALLDLATGTTIAPEPRAPYQRPGG